MGGVETTDAHVHLYWPEVNADPQGWAERAGERGWGKMCARRRRSGRAVQGFPSVDALLRRMDAAGVGRAVLLGWYWERAETCARQNEFYGEVVAAHGDRLKAMATVQTGGGGGQVEAELRRAEEAGLRGVGELCPPSQGGAYDGEGMEAVMGWAEARGWPVNLHVTDPGARDYAGKVETPEGALRGLAKRHPGVRMVWAHWGGGYAVADLPNVWVDTAASPLLYGEEVWAKVGSTVRPEQVVLGSDHPLDLAPGEAETEDGGWGGWVRTVGVRCPQALTGWGRVEGGG